MAMLPESDHRHRTLLAGDIASLQEQSKRFEEAALSTGPVDRLVAEDAVKQLYSFMGRPLPTIVWASSPNAGLYAAVTISREYASFYRWGATYKEARKIRSQVRSLKRLGTIDVGGEGRVHFYEDLIRRANTVAPEGYQILTMESFMNTSSMLASLWMRMENSNTRSKRAVYPYYGTARLAPFLEWQRQVTTNFPGPDGIRVGYSNNLYSHATDILRVLHWSVSYGAANVIGRTAALVANVMNSVGHWWDFRNVVVLVDRPTVLNFDSQHRLHCATGPSMQWADGSALYTWHGQNVPQKLIEGRWSPTQILRERNVEVRRAAVDHMGWDRFIQRAKLEILDGPVPDPGNPGQSITLYEVPPRVYNRRVNVLLCSNGTLERDGTRRRFGLLVPSSCTYALDAQAWIHTDNNHPVQLGPADYMMLSRRC